MRKGVIMNTISLESMQTELIREILNTDNMQVLEKLKKVLKYDIKGSEAMPNVVAEAAEPYKTKAEIIADLKEVCKDMKLAREGKLKGRPFEDLLNEL